VQTLRNEVDLSFIGSPFVRKYIVPGAIFQSVLVGGGYGTGREIVEYFTRFGAGGGILGLVVTTLCWIVVLAVTWEFARVFQAYDYRTFFRQLLGRGWLLFEFLFVLMFLIVLAVVASAAGEILRTEFGVPYIAGILAMLALVATLTFFGREIVTRSLVVWTVFLYGMFAFYFVTAFLRTGPEMTAQLASLDVASGWARSGFQYAMYNLFIIPAILFSTRDLQTRGEVVGSAVAASLICIVPALMFHVSFLADYPAILTREIPVHFVITSLGSSALLVVYLLALFGTFIETGAGLIQGGVERLDGFLRETRGAPMIPMQRALLAALGVGLSAGLATFGIIALIARGYGTISWGFFAVYVVPVLTIGVWQLHRLRARDTDRGRDAAVATSAAIE
jgi:uncharacterized membrane protein YkvI